MAGYRTARGAAVTIAVDDDLCKGCGICAHECPTAVYEMQSTAVGERPVATDPDACIECGTCELLCPDFALAVEGAD